MASHTTDPAGEANRYVERAKASLRAQVAVLERRLGDVRSRIDLPEQIRRHPLPAVGIAFALGALAGGRRRPRGPAPSPATKQSTLGGKALALVSALGLQLLRELAIGQLKHTAERWWSERGGSFDEPARTPDLAPHAEP
jgi:hypothetical protein